MIITESFVWINNPKTASTFVRESLQSLYTYRSLDLAKRWRMRNRWMKEVECLELRPRTGARYGTPTPHGTVSQIPQANLQLPIASAFRSPLSRYLSLFNYGDWKNSDQYPDSIENIQNKFPNFPELDFKAYVQYANHFYGNIELRIEAEKALIGPHSADFLRFFTLPKRNDAEVLEFDSWSQIQEALARVNFFTSSNINQELSAWLVRFHFDPKDLNFLQEKAPSNVSAKKSDGSELSLSEIEDVENQEWLLTTWMKASGNELAEALKVSAQNHRSPAGKSNL